MMFLISGKGFFLFVIFRESLAPYLSHFHATPTILAVGCGAIQLYLVKHQKRHFLKPQKKWPISPYEMKKEPKEKQPLMSLSKKSLK
jgi:AAA family ATP:ADP antiporter